MSQSLSFNGVELEVFHENSEYWIRGIQIGSALNYASPDAAIRKIYQAHADEFTESMTRVVLLPTEGGPQETRIFSLRGCHLLAMFARTPIAKQFRVWVLDVLEEFAATERLAGDSRPALPPSRPQDARATYADMKHLRDLVRQWENVTGRMRRTIVRQYEAWLKTPTSRFTLDDVANAMLFVQARLDAIASEEAARRSAARELPPAREKEEAPVSVPGIQEDFLVFQREAGRLITGAYELVLAASEYRRAMKKDGHSELDPAVTEKLTSACMAQATCMGQNIESLSRMLAILI